MALLFCKTCGEAKPEAAFRYPFTWSAKQGLANCMECYNNHRTQSQRAQAARSATKGKRLKRSGRLRVKPLEASPGDGRYKRKDLDRPE